MGVAGALEPDVGSCIVHMHGNYVVQKCIELMPPDALGFIIKAVEKRIRVTASHIYGCRVVQRLLEHCPTKHLTGVLDGLLARTSRLIMNSYGRFVIECMLHRGRKDDKKAILDIVAAGIATYATNKCTRLVVARCLEISSIGEHAQLLDEERGALIRGILGEPGCTDSVFQQLIHDEFCSDLIPYVVHHSRGPEKNQAQNMLRSAGLAATEALV